MLHSSLGLIIALFPSLTSEFLRNPPLAGNCLGLLPGQEQRYISSDSPGKYGVINLSFLSIDLFIDQLLIPLFQVTSHMHMSYLSNSKSALLASRPVWLWEFFIPCLSAILLQRRQGMAVGKLLAMKWCSVNTAEISITAGAWFC